MSPRGKRLRGKFTGESGSWSGWNAGGSTTIQGDAPTASEGTAESAWTSDPGQHLESDRDTLIERDGTETEAARMSGPKLIVPKPGGGTFAAGMAYEREHGQSNDDDASRSRRVREHLAERPQYYVELARYLNPDVGGMAGKMKEHRSMDGMIKLVVDDAVGATHYDRNPAAHARVDDVWREDPVRYNGQLLVVPANRLSPREALLQLDVDSGRVLHCGNCYAYSGRLVGKCSRVVTADSKRHRVHYFNVCASHRPKGAGEPVLGGPDGPVAGVRPRALMRSLDTSRNDLLKGEYRGKGTRTGSPGNYRYPYAGGEEQTQEYPAPDGGDDEAEEASAPKPKDDIGKSDPIEQLGRLAKAMSSGAMPTVAPIAGSAPRDRTPAIPDYQYIYYQPRDAARKKLEEEQQAVRRRADSDRHRATYGFHGTPGEAPTLEPVLRYGGANTADTTKRDVYGDTPLLGQRKPMVEAKDHEDRLTAGDPYDDDGTLRGDTEEGRVPRSPDRRDDDTAPDWGGRPVAVDAEETTPSYVEPEEAFAGDFDEYAEIYEGTPEDDDDSPPEDEQSRVDPSEDRR